MLRLYVQPAIPDSRAEVKKKNFNALKLQSKVGMVCLADCYTVDAKLNKSQIQKAKTLLANPLTETMNIAARPPKNFDYAIEVGFLPGVTDNVGSTAKETLADGAKIKFQDGQNVYFSAVFFVSFKNIPSQPPLKLRGGVKVPPLMDKRGLGGDITKIANSLYNPLIQRAVIKSRQEFLRDKGMNITAPKVKLSASTKVSLIDLNISDEELVKLGKLGIPDAIPATAGISKKDSGSEAGMTRRGPLSLSLDYLIAIREYFNKLGRKPTDIELETLAQTWSEHCKHTIFADPMDELANGLYKTYIKGATEKIRKQKGANDFCVSVFTDNSGAIKFDGDYLITHKVETHNTPSALDPFGGSITGIVGVNRDCLGFGLGAKPIINTYGFCLAEPEDKTILFRDKKLSQPMLSARKIFDGVISGVNAGGNQSGIPTNCGFLYFDPRFRGKPLVFAGTVGLIPRTINKKPSHIKQAKPGDLIVMAGGRVGADGIHGATFSSESLDSHSPATAVQIGDPITQKKLSDALVKEARDQGFYSSITDCGAGGLSSAVGEMAQTTGGCEVYLNKVPLKYPGLQPWQIWISESQERMVLAVPQKKWKAFQKLMQKRGVEATAIGKFTNSKKCVVKSGKQTVLDLDMDFLHNGRPTKHQNTQHETRNTKQEVNPKFKIKNLKLKILELISSPNLSSTDFVATQYDHEVQAGSVLKPLQGRGRVNAEATVTRAVLTSQKGVVLSCALNPSLGEIDPYNMAAASIDSAVRAAVAAGANVDYLALLDNFCWCSPENPERLWQLKQAARACYDIATAYGTPFISGKDSMYNDFKGFSANGQPIKISIPPTLLISAVGVLPDAAKSVSLDAKLPGDILYILGETFDELAGSEYGLSLFPSPRHGEGDPSASDLSAEALAKVEDRERLMTKQNVPSVNAQKNYQLYKSLFSAMQKNLVASSISVGRGGFAVALLKKLIGGLLSAEIDLKNLPGKWTENYQALFSESQGRILVSVNPKNAAAFEKQMGKNVFAKLGKITDGKNIIIKNGNSKVCDLKLQDAEVAYKKRFKDY